MFALHLRTKKRLEFWKVEKNTDRPSWANQAFTDGGFSWNDKSLSVKNVGGLLKMTVPIGRLFGLQWKIFKSCAKSKICQRISSGLIFKIY